MKNVIAIAMAGLLLAGCASQSKVRTVQLSQAFDTTEAQRLLQPGVNIVQGSALIRQQGGGVVTCAGLQVRLVPKTAYADERVRAIYGNNTKGFTPIHLAQIAFTPDHPGYLQYTKEKLCDAQGNFQFNDVADGDFYLVSQISWVVAQRSQGGSLMQSISVRNGQALQVVLSP